MLATVLIVLGLQAAQPQTAAPLAWIEGDWHCDAVPSEGSGPRRFEEYWVRDSRGGLVGAGRLIQQGTRLLEHMRIAPDAEGRLTFYGAPDGAVPVAFPVARLSDNEVVFENPTHDFPQRISYRHEPNRLIATVSRLDGGSARTWRYRKIGGSDGHGAREERAPCREAASTE